MQLCFFRKKIASWSFFPKQLLTCYIQQQNRKRTFHKSSIFSNCDFFTWPTSESGDSYTEHNVYTQSSSTSFS